MWKGLLLAFDWNSTYSPVWCLKKRINLHKLGKETGPLSMEIVLFVFPPRRMEVSYMEPPRSSMTFKRGWGCLSALGKAFGPMPRETTTITPTVLEILNIKSRQKPFNPSKNQFGCLQPSRRTANPSADLCCFLCILLLDSINGDLLLFFLLVKRHSFLMGSLLCL